MDRKQRTFFQSAPFRLRRNEHLSRKSFQRSRCEAAGQSYTHEHAAKGMTARFETQACNLNTGCSIVYMATNSSAVSLLARSNWP